MIKSTEYKFVEKMEIQLLQQQQQYGPLKFLSSQGMTETSHSINKIVKDIINVLKDNLGSNMYNIKIFNKNCNFESNNIIQSYARCYNYFLLNTNFSSQYLLKKDMRLGYIVNVWPTLSPYLFLQIIWYSKCEDFLIESLMHIPLDLCVEILNIAIKHINELDIPRARRFIFLLIYKIYYKCLWLHLGSLSEQNVNKCIYKLIIYFETLCNKLVGPKFISPHNLSVSQKYFEHGILIKNILCYMRKCIHGKIENYSENHNLAKLFMLTYGNFNEHLNYNHMIPANEMKSIIIRFDQQLTTLLLSQIKDIDNSEFTFWGNINDDENIMVSLQHTIIMECYYFIKFMRQNEFLVINKHVFHYLERLVAQRESNKFILTLPELCQDITQGNLYAKKELMTRYKEWDLSVLNFVNNIVTSLNTNDLYIILKYLCYTLSRVHTRTEKYKIYASVLEILNQLRINDMHNIILKYVEEHFDDKYLEYFYNEQSFDEFIEQGSFIEDVKNSDYTTIEQKSSCRAFLIFILLNPKEVLSKLIIHEINIIGLSKSILFQQTVFASFVQNYYSLKKDPYNMLTYILKNIILQQREILYSPFTLFMNNVLQIQMMTVDVIINQLYIPYLISSYFDEISLYNMLFHIQILLQNKLYTNNTNFISLIIALIKTASLLRRCTTVARYSLSIRIQLINNIMHYTRLSRALTRRQIDVLCLVDINIEPLNMKIMRPLMTTLEIIQQYEKRCFFIRQRLRTDPRCHPKLRSYVQSVNLDQEALIRHIMLDCLGIEYVMYALDFTFKFFYHFGWINEMIAYENLMRITIDVSQIVLMYLDKFPRHTFITLLYVIVEFCNKVVETATDKFETICHIMLGTLFSIKHTASRTFYADMYNSLLKCIKKVKLRLHDKYFCKIRHLIDTYADNFEPLVIPAPKTNCTCDRSSYCKVYSSLLDKKISAMYDTYLFVSECIKLPTIKKYRYSERLLHNLCLTRYLDDFNKA